MESNSTKDRITLSTAAAALLKMQDPVLATHLEPRGKVKIKGKGAMDLFFLNPETLSLEASASIREALKFGSAPPTKENAVAVGRIEWTAGELLGKGAFGRVYLGLNQATGDLMAVKILDYSLIASADPPALGRPSSGSASNLRLGSAAFRVITPSSPVAGGGPHFRRLSGGGSGLAAFARRLSGDADHAAQWLKDISAEIELCRSLNHDHLVKYLGVQRERIDQDGPPVVGIFMEFVPGGSLASLISKFGSLSEAIVSRYTRQILLGLAYLHGERIIHRDIKGGNIMVTRSKGLKIGDLGAAIRLDDPPPAAVVRLPPLNEAPGSPASLAPTSDDSDLQSLSMRGSVHWMSPEILAGKPYGRRTDIWSLGATMIEMLTGEPPFADLAASGNARDVAQKIVAAIAGGALPELPADISPELRAFLLACFTVHPSARPSAAALLMHPFVTKGEGSEELDLIIP